MNGTKTQADKQPITGEDLNLVNPNSAEVEADLAAEAAEQQEQQDLQTLEQVRAKHAGEEPGSSAESTKPAKAGKTGDGAKAATEGANQAAYEQAVENLLAEGVYDREEIEAMDPTKAIAKGEQAKQRLEASAAAKAKPDGGDQAKVGEGTPAKPAGETPESSNGSAATFDAGALTKPVVDALRESLIDPDGLDGPMAEFVTSLHQSVTQAVRTELEAVQAERQQLQNMMNSMADKEQRGEVAKRFPQVEDDAAWGKVREKADALLTAKISPDRATALRDAASMLHGFEAGGKAVKAREFNLRLRGQQPEVGDLGDRSPGGASSADVDSAVLSGLREGKSVDQVKREVGVA